MSGPNCCYKCKWRRSLPYDAHSACNHPLIGGELGMLTAMFTDGARKRLNLSGYYQGIKNGWFYWPINFDPLWLKTCNGFEQQNETKQTA